MERCKIILPLHLRKATSACTRRGLRHAGNAAALRSASTAVSTVSALLVKDLVSVIMDDRKSFAGNVADLAYASTGDSGTTVYSVMAPVSALT